jgi:UDP-N-acetylmuramoyl-L-alanyl-D-glutamate--2,6-diaminopimelate ligase
MSRAMRLRELLPDVAGIDDGLVITGLVQDSRAVRPGDAFVAIGPVANDMTVHGLRFVAQAQAAGAAVVLFEPPAPAGLAPPEAAIPVPQLQARIGAIADRFHGHPSQTMTVVGVTGTNGKTSTVQLLAQAWSLRGLCSGSIGTLGAGLHGQVVPTGFTTPLVLQLHALLAQLRDAGAQAVAMEVSSHALDQGRVDGVHFDVAIFTNLTRDHLDYHGDMRTYGQAKAKLMAWPGLKAAAINIDDAFGRELIGALPPTTRAIAMSSQGAQADIRAENILLSGEGLAFDLMLGDTRLTVRSPLLGRFNVDNLLAVAAALHALGENAPAIARTLGELQPVPGRMNRLGGPGQPLVVIDYAHTPDALEQALTSLRAHVRGRLICVFGCGGERDRGKRAQMAAIAQQHADVVIVTDDNPRSEDGDRIVAEIMAGFDAGSVITIERDRAAAIAVAIGQARPGDSVLIAGKGHEPYQEIGGIRHPFDDTRVAADALARTWPEHRA